MTRKLPPFEALAYVTRRRLFERLKSGPMSVGQLTQGTWVSRPAVSQHLKILKEGGLVREHREGRKRLYEIDPEGLELLRHWLNQFKVGAGASSGQDRSKSDTEK
jgi:DNA-binding transcriptional ArsR family regulator